MQKVSLLMLLSAALDLHGKETSMMDSNCKTSISMATSPILLNNSLFSRAARRTPINESTMVILPGPMPLAAIGIGEHPVVGIFGGGLCW
jgi:hypothetical protein